MRQTIVGVGIKILTRINPAFLPRQARRPSGWFGKRVMVPQFNAGNADLNQYMMECLGADAADDVLEIGCAAGWFLGRLSKKVGCRCVGLDFSPDMVRLAKKKLKSRDKITIVEGSISEMPFEDARFSKICTANTIYFWPSPDQDLAEIKRVLRPGGRLVIGLRLKHQMEKLPLTRQGFTMYTQAELEGLLTRAGFIDISCLTRAGDPFDSVCAVATKPNF